MLDLAINQTNSPVTREDIAARQNLPATYLAQLFAALTKARLVDSVRGPGGGYVLGRAACEISVGEIIRAVEGPVLPVQCVAETNCKRAGRCTLRQLYRGLGTVIEEYLDDVSLGSLVGAQVEADQLLLPCASDA